MRTVLLTLLAILTLAMSPLAALAHHRPGNTPKPHAIKHGANIDAGPKHAKLLHKR